MGRARGLPVLGPFGDHGDCPAAMADDAARPRSLCKHRSRREGRVQQVRPGRSSARQARGSLRWWPSPKRRSLDCRRRAFTWPGMLHARRASAWPTSVCGITPSSASASARAQRRPRHLVRGCSSPSLPSGRHFACQPSPLHAHPRAQPREGRNRVSLDLLFGPERTRTGGSFGVRAGVRVPLRETGGARRTRVVPPTSHSEGY